MLVYQLLVLPSKETLSYLSNVFSGCPFDLNLNQTFVEINSSAHEMEVDQEAFYEAQAGTAKVYFDTSTMTSSLLLPLTSRSLTDRCLEVREHAPSAFYGDHYFPHLVIKTDMPSLSRSYRSFIISISNSLQGSYQPLTFDAELISASDFHSVPQADFYASMMAETQR